MKGRERRVCVCERESFVVWGGCVEGERFGCEWCAGVRWMDGRVLAGT